MEFWPENQGQSSLYSKFGTVPGRNCAYNYQDRHQPAHYPLYYGEQQDQTSVSGYWTAPGSRTAGAPQEYTNWTDQEPAAPTSSHFPFILDRHPQQHQDLGEYQQQHEAREWTAAQRAAREYERGFLREGWQRRWEPCSPARYNREVSTKRNDNSYRELEAWAARYSHSLPRRRRIEAELRGASQGLLETSRAPERESRSGTDPRVAALQQVIQSANIRESGLWDRGGRQQAPTYYPPQTPVTDTSHMLDMKDKIGYQRRMYSQPPGYIAPPPYTSPHKSLPALHHSDTRWEQEGKRQTYWSQSTLRKQDSSLDYRKIEREDYKPDVNQYTFTEPETLNHRRQETDALQTSSPISIQKPHIQHEDILSLQQQPQILQAVENKRINEVPTSKVIEGRKFRLNKKTGGMTIFCLVSRLAGTTETPSLPLCTSPTNIQNTELEISTCPKDNGDNQTHKLADEVDFRVPTPTEQPNTCDGRNLEVQQTTSDVQSEKLKMDLSNKEDIDVDSTEKANDADSIIGRQVQSVQPLSVKYPLWREPSFTSKAETESLKANSQEEQLDVLHNQEGSAEVHPIDIEVRRLDIKEDTESEDSKGLLVIDTTCVVVKMELIPSPKKEHVHLLDSTPKPDSPFDIQSTVSPEFVESNSQMNQDVTSDQNTETDPSLIDERPETDLDSDVIEEKVPEEETEISPPATFPVYEKETLEERAARILGIPLYDSITEQQPEDVTSPLDSCVEDQEVEPSPVNVNGVDDAAQEIPEDKKSQNHLEVDQTEDAVCLQENDDAKDQVANEGGEDFARSQEPMSTMAEENGIDSEAETGIKASPETEMTEDLNLKSVGSEGAPEQTQEENPPVENDSSLLSRSADCEALNPTLMLSSPDATPLLYNPESNTEEGADPELITLNSADSALISAETGDLAKDTTELPESQRQFESSQPDDVACVNENKTVVQQTEEANKDPSDNITEKALQTCQENATEVSILQQQQPKCVPAEDVCVEGSFMTEEEEETIEDPKDQIQTLEITKEDPKEVKSLQHQLQSYLTEDQLPKEASDDPAGLLERTISQENVLQQQFDNGYKQDTSCLKKTYLMEEQPSNEAEEDPAGLLDQTISQENVSESQTEVIFLQQQLECVQTEDACVAGFMAEKQLPQEANEDPKDQMQIPEIATEDPIEVKRLQHQFQSYITEDESQTEVNVLQQQFKEDAFCVKETYLTEEELQREVDEDPTDVLEQTMSKQNAAYAQTQIEIELFQDTEPLNSSSSSSNCDASQSLLNMLSPPELLSSPSHKSDTEFVCLLDSVCPSALNPVGDAAPATSTPETVPPPLLSNSCEESVHFSTSSESPPDLFPSTSTPLLHEGCGSVTSDLSLNEEPQYPKSLWDAVNRIRKHTAPDSENEEEEVNELWDPESVGEGLGCAGDMGFEKIVFDDAGQQEVSAGGNVEAVEVGKTQQDQCHREPSRHAEEDALSCCSASSHGSGDTVIVADEDEFEERESETVNDEEFHTAEREQRCSDDEAKDGIADKGMDDDGGESVGDGSSQREEGPVTVVNTTNKEVEMLEKEQKGKEVEAFMPSDVAVSDEQTIESGSGE